MNNFLKNISIYSIGRILPPLLSFFLLPIYTSNTTTFDYGIISSMQILNIFIALTFTLALDLALFRVYHDYKNEKDKRDLLGTLFISFLLISIFFSLIYILFQNKFVLIFNSIEFSPYYIITIGYTFLNIFSIIPLVYLQINHKSKSYIFLSLLSTVLSICFILYFLVFKQQGAVGYLKGEFFSKLILLPIFLYSTIKIINFNFSFPKLINTLKFSLPMIPGLLSAWILNLSDRIFIERYFSLNEVAIYSVSYKISTIVLILSGAFAMAYYPFFYEKAASSNQISAKKDLSLINNTYVIVSFYFSVGLILFANNIFDIFFNETYSSGYAIVPLIVLGCFFNLITGLLNLMFNQEKKSLQLMYFTFIGAILNIILNFIFIPNFGMQGAALSTFICFLIILLIVYKYAKLYYFIEFDFNLIFRTLIPMLSLIIICFFNNTTFNMLLFKIFIFISVGLITIHKISPAFFTNRFKKL
jgi:O-antigen/teichoic acid export membrane protein